MRITIEIDGKEPIVYKDVGDAFLLVRQWRPGAGLDGSGMVLIPHYHTHSIGDLRELQKELRQSLLELEAKRNADPPGV